MPWFTFVDSDNNTDYGNGFGMPREAYELAFQLSKDFGVNIAAVKITDEQDQNELFENYGNGIETPLHFVIKTELENQQAYRAAKRKCMIQP